MIDYRSKILLERYDAPQVRLLYAISHGVDYHGIKKEVAISKITAQQKHMKMYDFHMFFAWLLYASHIKFLSQMA